MKKKQKSPETMPLSARFHPSPAKRLEFIPGQMIIKIKGQALDSAAGTLKAGGARLAARITAALPESIKGPLEYLQANAGLTRTTALFAKDGHRKIQGMSSARVAAISSVADSPHEDLHGFTVVSVDPKKVSVKLLKSLNASKAIEYAEPMPARWIARRTKFPATAVDPMQGSQWGLGAMGWFKAKLPSAAQSVRVKVAVLDTGVDQTHEDLQGLFESYDHQGGSAKDLIGHGTHVSGIIAAVLGNGIGISGLAACRLVMWKIFDDTPTNGEFYVNGELYLRALGVLADEGCSIVNLSIGGTQQSRTEALLFKRLRDRNVIPIAAMGNEFEEGNPTEFPAAYPGVIAVGAISSELRRASFSNTGRHIWVSAPGHTILSTVPMLRSRYRRDTKYASWSGTSMATPHVVAAAALYRAKNPGATADQVEAALKKCAKRLPEMKSKTFTEALGYGLVHLPKLL
jgi:subtilisin family serine protease